ncbi:putative mitochondrial protein, partial [Mucuna pruriens]
MGLSIITPFESSGSVVDRRFTSRYCMFLGGNLVTWKSMKQNVVARFSAETEFRAITHVQHDSAKHIEIDRHFIK